MFDTAAADCPVVEGLVDGDRLVFLRTFGCFVCCLPVSTHSGRSVDIYEASWVDLSPEALAKSLSGRSWAPALVAVLAVLLGGIHSGRSWSLAVLLGGIHSGRSWSLAVLRGWTHSGSSCKFERAPSVLSRCLGIVQL